MCICLRPAVHISRLSASVLWTGPGPDSFGPDAELLGPRFRKLRNGLLHTTYGRSSGHYVPMRPNGAKIERVLSGTVPNELLISPK